MNTLGEAAASGGCGSHVYPRMVGPAVNVYRTAFTLTPTHGLFCEM